MTDATQFRWTSAALTHVGLVRANNEDACLDLPEQGLWAIADGMGGHAFGEVASGMVINALQRLTPLNSLTARMTDATDTLQAVNQRLRVEATACRVPIIGTTVLALLAWDRYCGYLWAGDSRLYHCRNGVMTQLTRDHSPLEELKSLANFNAGDFLLLPSRNLITRAVGAAETLTLEYRTMQVNDGDLFLLCSDGLSNEVTEDDMRCALMAGDCQQASQALLDLALNGGGRDNISLIVVRVDDINDDDDKTILNPGL